MKYLLDTNAWIGYLRNSAPGIINKLNQLSINDVHTCSIVLSELHFGALLATGKQAAQNLASLALLEKTYPSFPLMTRRRLMPPRSVSIYANKENRLGNMTFSSPPSPA